MDTAPDPAVLDRDLDAQDSLEQDVTPGESSAREAQRQRSRRREAEQARDAAVAERDATSARLARMQTREAERVAAEVLADGSDLFTLGGVALDQLLDDEGNILAQAVRTAAEGIVTARGQRFAKPVHVGALFDGGADRGARLTRPAGWGGVFSPAYRDHIARGQR